MGLTQTIDLTQLPRVFCESTKLPVKKPPNPSSLIQILIFLAEGKYNCYLLKWNSRSHHCTNSLLMSYRENRSTVDLSEQAVRWIHAVNKGQCYYVETRANFSFSFLFFFKKFWNKRTGKKAAISNRATVCLFPVDWHTTSYRSHILPLKNRERKGCCWEIYFSTYG